MSKSNKYESNALFSVRTRIKSCLFLLPQIDCFNLKKEKYIATMHTCELATKILRAPDPERTVLVVGGRGSGMVPGNLVGFNLALVGGGVSFLVPSSLTKLC